MSRLITFGCSYTYGAYLPDCIKHLKDGSSCQGPTASKLAWPQLLGNRLGLEVHNMSTVGSSNLEILYHILNFKFKSDDIVVVMWTFPNRDLIFKRCIKTIIKPFKQLKSTFNDKDSQQWMIDYNEKDAVIKGWMYMQHAELYLKSKNILYLSYCTDTKILKEFKPTFVTLNTLHPLKSIIIDTGLDNMHPGIESHNSIANQMYIACQK